MEINMTQTCKETGIETFSRTRGGWMKLVQGYDTTKYGGYRFVGDQFVKVGNFPTNLQNGLYLDCSKHYNKEEDKVIEIMNLFKITDGNVELLNTIPKSEKQWANTFEDTVNDYFSNEDVTVDSIVNAIKEMTCNKELLQEVARALTKDSRKGKCWLNMSHFGAFMKEACVYNGEFELKNDKVQAKAVSLFRKEWDAKKYFNYEISDEYQLTMLYSFIMEHPLMKHYKDYSLVFEKIDEDYYTCLDKLDELRNRNINEIMRVGAIHDIGYWFAFKGRWATSKRIYIVVPNMSTEELIVQTFELQL